MRRILPLLILLSFGCQDDLERTNSSKSNPAPGEIERHLRENVPAVDESAMNAPVAAAQPAARAATPAPRAPAPVAVASAEPAPEPETREPAIEAASVEPVVAVVAPEVAPDLESNVQLVRVVVASAVEGREPVGAAPFGSDVERVFLYVEARNDGAPGTISVRWVQPDGTSLRPIELEIPTSRRWRTWATTRRVSGRAGTWSVLVTDAAGQEMARERFVVVASSSA